MKLLHCAAPRKNADQDGNLEWECSELPLVYARLPAGFAATIAPETRPKEIVRMRAGIRQIASLVAVAMLAIVSGCSPIHKNYGYVPDNSVLDELRVGVSTQDDVLEAAGVPATVNADYGEAWYYVSSRFVQGFNESKEVDRSVVAISFNSSGTVANVEEYSLQDGKTIAISRRFTETNVGRLRFIDQILRGVGRINPGRMFGQ